MTAHEQQDKSVVLLRFILNIGWGEIAGLQGRSGFPAPARPWEGADTLEWTLPSPAPYHTFETPPVVK